MGKGKRATGHSPHRTAMHRGVIIQRPVIHHIRPHAEGHRLVVGLVQRHQRLRLVLVAAADAGDTHPAAVVAVRQRVADIAVIRRVAGIIAATAAVIRGIARVV